MNRFEQVLLIHRLVSHTISKRWHFFFLKMISKVDDIKEAFKQFKTPEEIAEFQVIFFLFSFFLFSSIPFEFFWIFRISQRELLLLAEVELQRTLPVWFPTSLPKIPVWWLVRLLYLYINFPKVNYPSFFPTLTGQTVSDCPLLPSFFLVTTNPQISINGGLFFD